MLGGGERGIGGVSVSEIGRPPTRTTPAVSPPCCSPCRSARTSSSCSCSRSVSTGFLVTKGADGWWIVAIAVAELLWYGCGVLFARGARNAAPSTRRPAVVAGHLVLGWLALVVSDPNFVWLVFALFFPVLSPADDSAGVRSDRGAHGGVDHGEPVARCHRDGAVDRGAAHRCGRRRGGWRRCTSCWCGRPPNDSCWSTNSPRRIANSGRTGRMGALQRESGALEERSRLARDIHAPSRRASRRSAAGPRGPARQRRRADLRPDRRYRAGESGGGSPGGGGARARRPGIGAPRVGVAAPGRHNSADHTGIIGEVPPTARTSPADGLRRRVAAGRAEFARERPPAFAGAAGAGALTYEADEVRLDVVDDGIGSIPARPVDSSAGHARATRGVGRNVGRGECSERRDCGCRNTSGGEAAVEWRAGASVRRPSRRASGTARPARVARRCGRGGGGVVGRGGGGAGREHRTRRRADGSSVGAGLDGAGATARITAAENPPRVVVLTTYDTDRRHPARGGGGCLRIPAQGHGAEVLIESVFAAARGDTVWIRMWRNGSTGVCSSREGAQRPGGRGLDLVAQGLSNRAIAKQFVRERGHRQVPSGTCVHETRCRQSHRCGGRGPRTGPDHLTDRVASERMPKRFEFSAEFAHPSSVCTPC